jgi:crossover junction endodeoxyribonuclease RusA
MFFTLPYPPSANRYWRKTNRGQVYLSSEAKEYKQLAKILVKRDLLKGDLVFTAHFYRPQKSGDLSNRIKVLEDALQAVCYEDDKQIVEIHAYRRDDKTNPRVEVEIREI